MHDYSLSDWNGSKQSLGGDDYRKNNSSDSAEAFIEQKVASRLNAHKSAFEDVTSMTQAEEIIESFTLGLIPFYDAIKAGIKQEWGDMIVATTFDLISIAPGFGPAAKGIGKASILGVRAVGKIARGSIKVGGKLFVKSGSTLFKGLAASGVSLGSRLSEDLALGALDLSAIRRTSKRAIYTTVDQAVISPLTTARKSVLSTSDDLVENFPRLQRYTPDEVRLGNSGRHYLQSDVNQEVIKIGDNFIPAYRHNGKIHLQGESRVFEVQFDGSQHVVTRGRLFGGNPGSSSDELQARLFTKDGWKSQLTEAQNSQGVKSTFPSTANATDYFKKYGSAPNKQAGEMPLDIVDDEVAKLPVEGEKLTLYRGMKRTEADAILKGNMDGTTLAADADFSKLNGHIGDYDQALGYAKASDEVLLEFTLKPGAHELLFSPKISAIGGKGKSTAVIAETVKARDLGKFKVSTAKGVSEGSVPGYIGIKPEQGGEKISLSMRKREAKTLFSKLVSELKIKPVL